MSAPAAQWTPAPHRSRRRVALLVVGMVLAVAVGLGLVWWQSSDGGASPEPSPAAPLPGLAHGETFAIDFRTEMWVSGVLITAHSGNDSPDRSSASYSVSGPGFETIDVRGPANTVIDVPGWGQLTAESVRTERAERTLKSGETGAVPPSGTLYFRAATDFPLVENSQVFPSAD